MAYIGGDCAQTYYGVCHCRRIIEVSAGREGESEYRTEFFVKCRCGRLVRFEVG
jgi:hypothetical protein